MLDTVESLTAEAIRRCLDPNIKNLKEAIQPLIEKAIKAARSYDQDVENA